MESCFRDRLSSVDTVITRVDCKIITWCQRYRSSTASRPHILVATALTVTAPASFQLRMFVGPVSETDSQRVDTHVITRVDCKIITWCQRYRSSTASRHTHLGCSPLTVRAPFLTTSRSPLELPGAP